MSDGSSVVAGVRDSADSGEREGALVIAEAAATGHVEHILAKPGFGCRAQVAAWAVGRGLLNGVGPADRPTRRSPRLLLAAAAFAAIAPSAGLS